MERIIRALTEMREKAERSFIENSLIVHRSRLDSPIPDTKSDLEMIIELNQAISTLKNSMKWTKLEYGEWPEGQIVMRIKDMNDIVDYAHGFISRSGLDNEWYFYDYDGPNTKISIDSIYDIEPHYISLDAIELPKAKDYE